MRENLLQQAELVWTVTTFVLRLVLCSQRAGLKQASAYSIHYTPSGSGMSGWYRPIWHDVPEGKSLFPAYEIATGTAFSASNVNVCKKEKTEME